MANTMIQKKTDWSIRKALPDDDHRVAAVLGKNAWEGSKKPEALYQWKYQQRPEGDTVRLIATNRTNDVVATSMFMPWRLAADDETIPACQWTDLFVELEYRGQAIADLTLRQGLTETRQAGARICFAFPNANSVSVHKKNGGVHLGNIVRYAKPLDVEYLVRRKVPNALAAKAVSGVVNLGLKLMSRETYRRGHAIDAVDVCGAEFDDLWARCRDSRKGMVTTQRDSDYLNWKYLRCPDKCRTLFALKSRGRVDGFAVLESAADVGFIVDIMAVSTEALEELVVFSLNRFRKEGRDSAAFLALEENMYVPELKRFGFVARPDVKHLYVYFDDTLAGAERMRDPRNWFITIGDCDIDHM